MNIEGVTVHYTETAMRNHGGFVNFIRTALVEMDRILPANVMKVMRTTRIYVNDHYFLKGKVNEGACLHPSAQWLRMVGDMTEKEGQIEIYNIGGMMKEGPNLIFHEMAHAFEWRQGVRGDKIKPLLQHTYAKVKAAGKYGQAKHISGRMS